jgi:transglutaminase-like putative cysteine protease
MYYSIRHNTRFRYSASIVQSVMEVRMQPRSEGSQHCLKFQLVVTPTTRLQTYQDYLGNTVHHFDIPGQHRQLNLAAESLVELRPSPELPEQLSPDTWNEVDRLAQTDYDMVLPSHFARPTPLLEDLRQELNLVRRDDPLSLMRELNTAIYNTFSYEPYSTDVDSPIDDALQTRSGVCQDYSHIMITLVRGLGIPCRYVSGYLYHRKAGGREDRSAEDATHAWVEVLLPQVGWIGLDPTNNLICGERHIRVAVGRDYADVPPTKGTFKGQALTELSVGVRVALADAPVEEVKLQIVGTQLEGEVDPTTDETEQAQQQQ